MESCDLIGIGSPLVDFVLKVDDAFLEKHVSGAKGGMELVEADDIAALIEKSDEQPVQAAGGAAANTTTVVGGLGLKAAFIGASGSDDLAEFYKHAMSGRGCEPRLIERPDVPTGRVLSLVTPDAQRTMRTCLGAAATIGVTDIDDDTFAGAKVVMLEGYTLFNHDLTKAIAAAAKKAGAKLALDLASFEVVSANKEMLLSLMDEYVDIVFANEDEAEAWVGNDKIDYACNELASRVEIAVVKMGKDGAWIATGDERIRVNAEVVEAVDTTGAGDTWAGGFLAGYLRGLPLQACGELGAKVAAKVVAVDGAAVPDEAWPELKGWFDGYSA